MIGRSDFATLFADALGGGVSGGWLPRNTISDCTRDRVVLSLLHLCRCEPGMNESVRESRWPAALLTVGYLRFRIVAHLCLKHMNQQPQSHSRFRVIGRRGWTSDGSSWPAMEGPHEAHQDLSELGSGRGAGGPPRADIRGEGHQKEML
jgi:hypothetical protein